MLLYDFKSLVEKKEKKNENPWKIVSEVLGLTQVKLLSFTLD